MIQDPWEEGGQPLQPMSKSKIGGLITQVLKTYFLGGLGMGASKKPNLIEGGAVQMPWEQDQQKITDSFSGFFEKLDNPAFNQTFSQLINVLYPGKDYRR